MSLLSTPCIDHIMAKHHAVPASKARRFDFSKTCWLQLHVQITHSSKPFGDPHGYATSCSCTKKDECNFVKRLLIGRACSSARIAMPCARVVQLPALHFGHTPFTPAAGAAPGVGDGAVNRSPKTNRLFSRLKLFRRPILFPRRLCPKRRCSSVPKKAPRESVDASEGC